MLSRSAATAVLTAALLLLTLLAPVAGAQPPVVAPVTSTVVEGLPAGGAHAFAAASGTPEVTPSVAREMPMPFSLVGFAAPAAAEVEFRTSGDGEVWTPWREAHVNPDEGPDPDSPEANRTADARLLSEPAWVGESSWLQIRVAGGSPERVGVHLVDALGQSRNLAQRVVDAARGAWQGTPRPAVAQVDQPAIVTRAQWGADESLRKGNVRYAKRATVGFVHHTADGKPYTAQESAAVVRGIYRYHTVSRGWDDIGYNFLVDRFGTVYEGRAGGIDKAVIGAHAGGFNTGTFGISMMGDFTSDSPPGVTMDAVGRVLAWKFDVHHADLEATVRMTSGGSTRYADGTSVDLEAISGHRDVSATACPGDAAYPRLASIRAAAKGHAEDMVVDPGPDVSAVALTEDGPDPRTVRFSARMKPSGPWTLEVRSAEGTLVHVGTGSGASVASTWQIAGASSGIYTWSIASPGRRTATGELPVLHELVDRAGTADDASRATVELSEEAFPDDGEAEHAVVARRDVFADALAGGPLAGTKGPLLLTRSDGLDERVADELERVLPEGRTVFVLGGDGAVSPAVADALAERWEVKRLSGPERTATAAAVAEVVLARGGTKTAMLARAFPDAAQPWADALAGGAYGAAHDVPVLLTATDTLGEPAKRVLRGVDATIILGGTGAVSQEVAAQTPNPRRISGPERTATAAAIATELWGRSTGSAGDRFIVAAGFRDGAWTLPLAASPLAARHGAPLLLTDTPALSAATESYLDDLGYSDSKRARAWVLGGTSAVSDAAAAELASLLQ